MKNKDKILRVSELPAKVLNVGMLPAWALRGHPLKSEILKNLSKTLVDQEFADNLGPNSFGLTQNSFFRDSYCKIVTFYPGIPKQSCPMRSKKP